MLRSKADSTGYRLDELVLVALVLVVQAVWGAGLVYLGVRVL